MTGFDDLEGQLLDAIERRGSRRSPRASAVAVLASSALVAALAVFAIVLLGHRKPSQPSPPRTPAASPQHTVRTRTVTGQSSSRGQILFVMPHASQSVLRSVSAALFGTASNHPVCSPVAQPNPHGATISQGTPTAAVLSVLGVLRRPSTPADRLPATLYRDGRPLLLGEPSQVYVRYIRRARVVNGVAYYLIPGVIGSPPPPTRVLNRCYAEEMQALRNRLSHVPGAQRTSTLSVGATVFAEARASAEKQRPYDGVTELDWQLRATGGGGGSGAASAATIEKQGMLGATDSDVFGVVPSGVAKVTLEWGGKRRPVTTDVINNVFVVSTPGAAAEFPPPKMIWRAANGRAIKTVAEPG